MQQCKLVSHIRRGLCFVTLVRLDEGVGKTSPQLCSPLWDQLQQVTGAILRTLRNCLFSAAANPTSLGPLTSQRAQCVPLGGCNPLSGQEPDISCNVFKRRLEVYDQNTVLHVNAWFRAAWQTLHALKPRAATEVEIRILEMPSLKSCKVKSRSC